MHNSNDNYMNTFTICLCVMYITLHARLRTRCAQVVVFWDEYRGISQTFSTFSSGNGGGRIYDRFNPSDRGNSFSRVLYHRRHRIIYVTTYYIYIYIYMRTQTHTARTLQDSAIKTFIIYITQRRNMSTVMSARYTLLCDIIILYGDDGDGDGDT